MADEPNTTLATTTPPVTPATNTPEARNPDGSIKDGLSAPTTDPSPPSTTTDKSTTTDPEAPKADAPVVPEKYEFKAPEGYEVDPAFVEKATPVLKELGITAEGAQKLFEVVQDKIVGAQQEMIDTYETMRDGWRKELAADKTLGNGKDGLSPTTSQNISAAMNLLPPELQTQFKDAMNLTGAGDHPAFIKAWNTLGAMAREGKLVPGGKPSPTGQQAPNAGPKSAAQALYPTLPSSAS